MSAFCPDLEEAVGKVKKKKLLEGKEDSSANVALHQQSDGRIKSGCVFFECTGVAVGTLPFTCMSW